MLRLAIDLSSFRYGKAAGFNEYALCLVQGLARVPRVELELTLFVRRGQAKHFRPLNDAASIVQIPFGGELGRLLWHHAVPRIVANRFDAFLFPANFAPILVPRRSVLVVHDLNFLVNRDSFGPLNMFYRQVIQRRSIRQCAGVIAISEQTANEVESYAGRRPEVIHNPVRLRATAGVATESLILCASSLSPHKNIPEAYQACLRAVEEDQELTVAFIGNWQRHEFPAPCAHPRIQLLGFVDEETRSRLFAACRLVLAPSRYEGFGMPFVEALLSGKALACSDIPVAREVGGDCAYWIAEPFGASQILDALREARSRSYAPKTVAADLMSRYLPESVAQRYVRCIASAVRGG